MTGLFLGLTTIDLQYLVHSFPKENGKQKSEDFRIDIGGPALNAAAKFVELGGKAKFFTVLGRHALTDYVKSQCQRLELDLIDLAPDFPGLPIVASVISNTRQGHRSIIRNKGVQPRVSLELLQAHLPTQAEVVLLDGFHMEAAIHMAQYAQQQDMLTVLDGGSWKTGMNQLLPHIDMAICSADFSPPEGSPMEYLKKQEVNFRVITRGEKDIWVEVKDDVHKIPVPKVQAVDSLGAGDIFHGAFCFYMAEGADFHFSLEAAAKIASASTTQFGLRT